MNRRQLIAAALASPMVSAGRASAQAPVFVGDMHFHSFFGLSKYHSRPVAQALAAGQATLVAWSLGGDIPWIDTKTYKQNAVPQPGETFAWFQRELGRIKAHIAEQGLGIVQTPSDVDLALRGKPHIVLAVEGANLIENDAGRVKAAHDLGVRHLQLVHFTRNTIGDIQTNAPEHQGLTALGKDVVRECNRLGILIDLAHCSEQTARDALSVSRAPVVWSHGSVSREPTPPASAETWRRRQLSMDTAREIAKKGGVVGIWAFAPDVGRTVEGYGNRIAELAAWLGEDHAAFGTDMNGLAAYALLSGYADVRPVVEHWHRQRIPEQRITKLAIGNYARVLKAALGGRA